MRWKKGSPERTVLSLALIALGVAACILPFSFRVTGLFLIALGLFVLLLPWIDSAAVREGLILLVCLGCIVVEILMGQLRVQGVCDPAALQCEAAVVLGAQVNGTEPSMALRTRLDAAVSFMQENEKAVVFLSGGQGSGEDISEAQAMYNYLKGRGVDMSRVYLEPDSTSTLENIQNTMELAEQTGIELDEICIITNEFHMCRARFIASRLGLNAVSYSATTKPWIFKMNYYLREIPAFFKAWVQTTGI